MPLLPDPGGLRTNPVRKGTYGGRHAQTRPISRRCSLLGRYLAAGPGRGSRVLRGAVRLDPRGPDAGRRAASLLRGDARRRARGRRRLQGSAGPGDLEHVHRGGRRGRGRRARARRRRHRGDRAVRHLRGRADGRVHRHRGRRFRLWQAGRNIGAELVNVPGSWNFSSLNARDAQPRSGSMAPSSAGRSPIPAGSSMVIVPGYGDYLETIDPGVKARHGRAARPRLLGRVAWLDTTDGRAELERHLHDRGRRRERGARGRTRGDGARRALRRPVAADLRDPRPAGRECSRSASSSRRAR